MIVTKILYDETKLAEMDCTRSILAMLPPEAVKNNAQPYFPPKTVRVNIDINYIFGVGEIERDPLFTEKFGVESYFRLWLYNGLCWYIDGSLEPCEYEKLLQVINTVKKEKEV